MTPNYFTYLYFRFLEFAKEDNLFDMSLLTALAFRAQSGRQSLAA